VDKEMVHNDACIVAADIDEKACLEPHLTAFAWLKIVRKSAKYNNERITVCVVALETLLDLIMPAKLL